MGEIIHTFYILQFVKFGSTIYQIQGHLTGFDDFEYRNLKILDIFDRVTQVAYR